jgi:hypothetical protein
MIAKDSAANVTTCDGELDEETMKGIAASLERAGQYARFT